MGHGTVFTQHYSQSIVTYNPFNLSVEFNIYSSLSAEGWHKAAMQFEPKLLDVYYTPSYYNSWKEYEGATAYCAHFSKSGIDLLYPFFVSEITGYASDARYYDISSAYGYGGAIASGKVDDSFRRESNALLDEWCRTHNIVAEFIRANPASNIYSECLRAAEYSRVRTNVYTNPAEIMENALNDSTSRNIRKALRNGVVCSLESVDTLTEVFHPLYQATAERLAMSSYYQFSAAYFDATLKHLRDSLRLLVVRKEEVAIAASVLFSYNGFLTYHLGASDSVNWHLRPNDVMFSEMRELAKSEGIHQLSFGGGTTSSSTDSLYLYKQKFGKTLRDVFIGKRIHNQKVYDSLCAQWAQNQPHLVESNRNIFLKYRVRD